MEAPWSDQFDQTNIQLIEKSKVCPEVIIAALLIEMKRFSSDEANKTEIWVWALHWNAKFYVNRTHFWSPECLCFDVYFFLFSLWFESSSHIHTVNEVFLYMKWWSVSCTVAVLQYVGAEFICAVRPVLKDRWTSELEQAWKVLKTNSAPYLMMMMILFLFCVWMIDLELFCWPGSPQNLFIESLIQFKHIY